MTEMTSTLVLAEYHAWHGLPSHKQPPPYDSSSTDVIARHIEQAKAKCIDGFVVNWYGPRTGLPNDEDREFMDKATAELLSQAEDKEFKIALMYDEGAVRGVTSSMTMTQVISDLLYAKQYFTMTSYLTINDKPALFVFPYEDIDLHINWREVHSQLGNSLTLLDKDPNPQDADHDSEFDGFFAWVQPTNGKWEPNGQELGQEYLEWFYTEMMTPTYANKVSVGGVWPGFDDSMAEWGQGRYMSRRCGQTWEDTWDLAKKYSPPYILISTWNDFEEGTDIENGVVKVKASYSEPAISGVPTVFEVDCVRGKSTWDFGDGSDGSGITITHIYTESGLYTATVMTSISDTTYTDSVRVEVREDGPFIWQEDFNPMTTQWIDDGAKWIDIDGPTANLTQSDTITDYGNVESEVIEAHFDAKLFLYIEVSAVDADSAYSVQLYDQANQGTTYIDILNDITTPGKHLIELSDKTGWNGKKNFTIKIWITGESKSATFDLIEVKRMVFLPKLFK